MFSGMVIVFRVTGEVTESLHEEAQDIKRLFTLISCRGGSAPGIIGGKTVACQACDGSRVEK